MKNPTTARRYSELVRNQSEIKESIAKLRKEVVDPTLFYSTVDLKIQQLRTLLKLERQITKSILEIEINEI